MIVMRKDFYYDSCGGGRIHACRWEPEGTPQGVFQIVHGIAEHVFRYDDFANYLTSLGLLVVAEDHMGHGKSIDSRHPQGYFSGGWFNAVGDVYQLLTQMREEYPDIPYILFGHSMGSFLVRTILEKYPQSGICGCVICGTGWQPIPVLRAGIGICNGVCKVGDEKKPSKVLQKMIFGAYNNRVEHPRTAYDWLSRLDTVVDAYIADPDSGFLPSAALVRDMLTGISYIQKPENLGNMQKDLPILFVAGGDDPVGNYGKGVHKTAQHFLAAGMKKVTTRIYPMCRHEILNEVNRKDIYRDIAKWVHDVCI